ncbi:beta-phosphoglucomutase-like phosphatase (HAD superfamily) [Anoxybacillus caldiproteolyticus]|uniref:Beta-phosphoglucomutase-like phosphatase (HAD superfamily) n=1 Tax=Thermaerobacillus caldiproteolyticus TaxID=247480 RepID=A0A7V9Z7T2_9BACL|nr:beta-phosphoglucomutase-like phosphatase (HAD superfamily) [Anoxybacillus caldiproteolyticus]
MSRIPFALIFDMDGTLFQTEKILVPALHKRLTGCGVKDNGKEKLPFGNI